MKTRLFVPFFLLLLLSHTLGAQEPADSTSPSPSPPDRYVIDAAKLVREGGARSISDLLISQVPGLLVVPGSGLNGGGSRIRFAGARSLIDDAWPLILVDGLRIDAEEDATVLPLGGPGPLRLDDLPAEDIESVEVIRGPASGAIYGLGAASGVILINTKRGRSGPLRWEAYAQSALRAKPSRWPANYGGVDLDNSNPWMRQGACTLTAQAAGYCVQDYVQTFNPLVERNPFATRLRRQVGFSGSGGPRWGAFRVAGGFDGDGAAYDVPALAPGDDYRRWNIGASGAINPVPSLEVRGTVGVVSSDLRLPMYAPVKAAVYGPSDSAGFSWAPWFQGAGTQAVDRTSAVLQVGGHALPWLELRGLVGLDDVRQRDVSVSPTSWRSDGRRHAERRSAAFSAAAEDLTWRGLRFSTTIGIERLARRLTETERQMPDTAPGCEAPFPCVPRSLVIAAHTLGVYVLQEIGLRGRLVVTGALRRDRFDEYESAGGTHGSLAVAWVARPERAGPLGRVELRTAYGTAGRPFPDQLAFTVSPYPSPEPEPLRPERTRAFELGADAKLLDGRWRGQVTYYALRSDVLDYGFVQSVGGLVFTFFNGTAISNRGVAATLIGSVVDRPAVGWDLRLSVWGNRNRVVKRAGAPMLYGGVPAQSDNPGYPTGGYWAWPVRSYVDTNGDGIITRSEVSLSGNYAWAGTPYPTQGAVVTSAWRFARRWRLSATLDYRAGQTLFNEAAWARCLYLVCREVQDPGTPLADQATAVAASTAPPPAYFEDADYLKLRELWVAFELPPAAAAAVGARSATITLAGRDLLTWTSYSGADPESGSYGRATTDQPRSVQDVGTVPVPRSWALRVRLSY